MKMQFWIYRLNKDENQAFNIQEHKKIYTIWHDKYEGGYAYDSDWSLVDGGDEFPNVPDSCEWNSYDEAYKWIVDNYGEVTEIEYD